MSNKHPINVGDVWTSKSVPGRTLRIMGEGDSRNCRHVTITYRPGDTMNATWGDDSIRHCYDPLLPKWMAAHIGLERWVNVYPDGGAYVAGGRNVTRQQADDGATVGRVGVIRLVPDEHGVRPV